MVVWNFAATYSLSAVQARQDIVQRSVDSNAAIASRYTEFESEINKLDDNKTLLNELDSGIEVSKVMAELSWVVSDKILIKDISISTEKVEIAKSKTSSSVSFKRSSSKKDQAIPQNDYKFKVHIVGLAENAENVAGLISSLENSQYFTNVIPGLMQNEKDSSNTSFQIDCYIANYVEKTAK